MNFLLLLVNILPRWKPLLQVISFLLCSAFVFSIFGVRKEMIWGGWEALVLHFLSSQALSSLGCRERWKG